MIAATLAPGCDDGRQSARSPAGAAPPSVASEVQPAAVASSPPSAVATVANPAAPAPAPLEAAPPLQPSELAHARSVLRQLPKETEPKVKLRKIAEVLADIEVGRLPPEWVKAMDVATARTLDPGQRTLVLAMEYIKDTPDPPLWRRVCSEKKLEINKI